MNKIKHNILSKKLLPIQEFKEYLYCEHFSFASCYAREEKNKSDELIQVFSQLSKTLTFVFY